ncbi:hypothetical protein F5B20DRAFT_557629 [Whalleya microplaca]|nr:hypothetical protein F5B20DRAFT_557629 [Whalleya microplaca]
MFRRFWAGPRCPAFNFPAYFRPRPQSQPCFTHRLAGPRHGPRGHTPQPKVLKAGIYGTIYISIALLMTNESLDWETRSRIAIDEVEKVMSAQDTETKTKRYWELAPRLLKRWSGAKVVRHDRLRGVDPESPWQVEIRMMTTKDPDKPGGTFVLCQGLIVDPANPNAYFWDFRKVTEPLLPAFETFAKKYGPDTRGALLIYQPNGGFQTVYFDGKRAFNVAFLEWQTAASIGLTR